MNKMILFGVMLSVAAQLNAQSPNYVDFEWDVLKFGYVASGADGLGGGVAFGGELRYNATDNFSIGFSGNGSLFGDDFDGDTDLGMSGSSLIVGDYYLKNNASNRAFFGLGTGLYTTGTLKIRNDNIEEVIDGTTGLGLAPRVGFEFGHIRLQGQYNMTLKEGHHDYFSLTLALTLWGGYKGG